jgi:hypothetical protein
MVVRAEYAVGKADNSAFYLNFGQPFYVRNNAISPVIRLTADRRRRGRAAVVHRGGLRRYCAGAVRHSSPDIAATCMGLAHSAVCHRQPGDVLGCTARRRFLSERIN